MIEMDMMVELDIQMVMEMIMVMILMMVMILIKMIDEVIVSGLVVMALVVTWDVGGGDGDPNGGGSSDNNI